jgi:hypothetical protein
VITDTPAFQILNEAMKGMSRTLNIIRKPRIVYHKIQVKFDYGVFHIYHSWVMALFLLENSDFLGLLRKVNWCNNCLWMVNVKYTIIKFNLYFMVYSIVLKFEKIWLSGTLNIIRKPKKSYLIQNVECGGSCDHQINFL